MNKQIFEDVDHYISDLFNAPDSALDAIERSADEAGITKMNISPNQGKLLQVLARSCNAKRILEVGTQYGYSTYWLAQALPAGGKLVTIELNPDYAAMARNNMQQAGLSDKVEIREGKGLDVLPVLYDEMDAPFDMVFMDADKPPYTEYLQWALKMSRPGTIIVADNVVRDGKVLDPDSTDAAVKGVQRFNKSLAEDPRVRATIIQNIGIKDHDGMAIAVVI